MSGIAGVINFDGAPVDRALLDAMTAYLRPHGCDAEQIRIDGGVGFVHALLRTTAESSTEQQPCSLDGHVWITADARIDARDDLRRALDAAGRIPRPLAPDVELILHAYAAWGEACVDHLIGDFAFAIWDTSRRALFCARDQLGIKPFYYAVAGRTLVFSNHLSAVRLHPALPETLDEQAIADFLVFGYCLDADRSSFQSIKRLPPAHVLGAADGATAVRRYWDLRIGEPHRYLRREEYLDEFRSRLTLATQDRLRASQVSVMMSGGLDSPSLAVIARDLLASGGRPFELRAHTIVFDRIAPDEERHYSTIAARAIGIPIHHHPFDDFGFPPPGPEPPGYPPEPRMLFDWTRTIAVYQPASLTARVILKGEGADPLLLATAEAPQRLVDEGRYWTVLKEYAWLTWARRQIPYFGIRTMVQRAFGTPKAFIAQPFPDWMRPELVGRMGERWRELSAMEHPRPALDLLDSYWPWLFETTDPLTLQLPAEARYPFLDIRLVEWTLGIPEVPWCMEKSILRLAMGGRLPASILRRRKAPLAGNVWASLVPPSRTRWWEPYMRPAPELAAFVDVAAANAALARVLPRAQAQPHRGGIDLLRSSLRPLSLNLWLNRVAHGNLRQV